MDASTMDGETKDDFPGVRAPEPYRSRFRAGRHALAVRAETRGGDAARMAAQLLFQRAAGRVPNARGLVGRTCDDASAIRPEFSTGNDSRVPQRRRNRVAIRGVPNPR